MVRYFTLPVALAAVAVAASTIAGAPALESGFRAMLIGAILSVLPFMFAVKPTLILVGGPMTILHDAVTAVIAGWMLASALEGWLYFSPDA